MDYRGKMRISTEMIVHTSLYLDRIAPATAIAQHSVSDWSIFTICKSIYNFIHVLQVWVNECFVES